MAKLMRILTLTVLPRNCRTSLQRLRDLVGYCEILLTRTCDQQNDQKRPRPCFHSDVDFCCIQLAALQEKDRCTAMKVVAERGRGGDGDGDVDVEKLLKMAREMPDVCNLPPYRCPW